MVHGDQAAGRAGKDGDAEIGADGADAFFFVGIVFFCAEEHTGLRRAHGDPAAFRVFLGKIELGVFDSQD